jgi:antitoxin MazE
MGKSHGVRIPDALLEQTGLSGEVEIVAEGNALVIRPRKEARLGWSAAFREMRKQGDDDLLDGGTSPTSWDDEEWDW